jgi:hypothetical protein
MKKVKEFYKEWARKHCKKGEILELHMSPTIFLVAKKQLEVHNSFWTIKKDK